MKLIHMLHSSRWPNGQMKKIGLFECAFCFAQVERPFYAGKRFKSCGCEQTPCGVRNPKYRHGACDDPIYGVWRGMIARCSVPEHKSYKDYGGRGIRVCDNWRTASKFIKWARRTGYRKGLYIDRIDHDGGYSPENCRWLTPKESARHKRVMKLNETMAETIRSLLEDGWRLCDLAVKFGVTEPMIRAIRNGTAWA
jgi:hypothetical protein